MLAGLLASVGIPVLVDLFKSAAPAVTRKVFGTSVEDQIKLDNANVERLKALAELDNPHGTPSRWVVDLRASFRYISAAALILTGVVVALKGVFLKDPAIISLGLEISSYPFGFIFGERMVLAYKPQGK
jgi:hypothetical protein